jgi:hypothetical protein
VALRHPVTETRAPESNPGARGMIWTFARWDCYAATLTGSLDEVGLKNNSHIEMSVP